MSKPSHERRECGEALEIPIGTYSARSESPAPRGARKQIPLSAGPSFSKHRAADPIVVLGLGFAGLAAAYSLRRAIPEVEVVAVNGRRDYVYRPSLPQVALGKKGLARITIDVDAALGRRGIRFCHARVLGLDPDGRRLLTDAGPLPYSRLLVALGSEIAFEEVPGLARWGHVLCEADRILRLKEEIAAFSGGEIVVALSRDNPYELMDIGFVAELCHLLESSGRMGRTRISYLTPYADVVPFLGARARAAIRRALQRAGVEIVAGAEVTAVDHDRVTLAGGTSLPSRLSVFFPPYRGRSCLSYPGLTDGRGYLLVDERLRNPAFPEIYGAGDSIASCGPKSGRQAMMQGKTVAHEITRSVRDITAEAQSNGKRPLEAIVELGGPRGIYLRSHGAQAREWVFEGVWPRCLKFALERWFVLRRGEV
jgi:sulfide:quinone oxidoreductase